jgi:hypothetical protein
VAEGGEDGIGCVSGTAFEIAAAEVGALHACPPAQARPAGAQIPAHAAWPHAQQASPNVIHISDPVRAQVISSSLPSDQFVS